MKRITKQLFIRPAYERISFIALLS